MTTKLIGIGAGGHAKAVMDIIRENSNYQLMGLLDADHKLHGKKIHDVPVMGDDTMLPQLQQLGITHFFMGVGGSGNNEPRKSLYKKALSFELLPLVLCHSRSVISPFAEIDVGTVVMPCAVINSDARIGQNVIINTGAIIEHDCIVENHVHIATGATLASTVTVLEGAHIGAGASIRQCLTIGKGAIVGAGAVVVKDVAPRSVVVGSPARILRTLI